MIWLIGNKGMLGRELSALLEGRGVEHFGTDLDCDITDLAALREMGAGRKASWIVNCSAYTAVDKAEDEEALARSVNALGAGNVAAIADELGARMIHISTDYVFAGDASAPYVEDDPIAPAGAYGRTKAEGEALVRAACAGHFILRTAWLYGRHGRNFVYTMLRLMNERDEVGIVADQRGSPTWARDLALAILRIVGSGSEAYGTYHYTDAGDISWFEFAAAIQRIGMETGLLGRAARLLPLTTAEYPTKARRPPYSVLSKDKIVRQLGVAIPEWEASLREFMLEERARTQTL